MKRKLAVEKKLLTGLLSKRKMDREFIKKRARDFAKEPNEFLRAYCDRLNIWEEGSLLIRKRLQEIRESRHLPKKLKVILERAENELLNQNWMNIPKHPDYDRQLEKFLGTLGSTKPHSQ